MKLSSYLKISRHGVFYYRLQYRFGDRYKEINVSLGTRDPELARGLSYMLCSRIKPYLATKTTSAMAIDPKTLNPDEIKKLITIEGGKISYSADPNPTTRKAEEDVLLKLASQFQAPPTQAEEQLKNYLVEEKKALEHYKEAERYTLSEAIDNYINVQCGGLKPSTITANRERLQKLSKVLGENRLLNSITASDAAKAFEKIILTAPNDSKRHTASIGRISFSTAKNTLITWKAFFNYQINSGKYRHANPVASLKPPAKGNSEQLGAEAFDSDELKKIFDVKNFSDVETPHEFFAPWVLLYTGARANEIACLTVDDVLQKDGYWCFRFEEGEGKSLKNKASKRAIPIHPKIIEMGFLDYVNDVKSLGLRRVFPYLEIASKTGKRERKISDSFIRLLKLLKIWRYKVKVLHSLRDTLISKLRQAKVEEIYRYDYLGHAREKIQDTHYSGKEKASPSVLYDEVVKKISFDLTIPKYSRNRFDTYNKKHQCD